MDGLPLGCCDTMPFGKIKRSKITSSNAIGYCARNSDVWVGYSDRASHGYSKPIPSIHPTGRLEEAVLARRVLFRHPNPKKSHLSTPRFFRD